jgi:large subunit ribosomal protein L6
VDVTLGDHVVHVKGPKGQLSQHILPAVTVTVDGGQVLVARKSDDKPGRSAHGLTRTLVANMVTGVTTGYDKTLEIVGVGYRVAAKGAALEFALGYSHSILFEPPDGISFEVQSPTRFVVRGIDKQQVGEVAANIRMLRKPEPYKGKGVRYQGENVRRKVGKAGKK